MSLERVLEALAAHNCPPKKSASGWQSKCPAHDDHTPSLTIGLGADDRVLLHCLATCSVENVLESLGLTMADLFPPKTTTSPTIEATYDYNDEHGTLLFQVVRRSDKSFRQRRPDGQGGWIYKLEDTRRVIYHLSAVLEGIANGETVYICEGEKDVEALERAGEIATCNPGGAGKWKPEYTDSVRNATQVVIVADNDDPGLAHARAIQQSLNGTPNRIVRAAKGKDAADHLAAGLRVDQFLELEEEPTSEPKKAPAKTVVLRNAATDYRRKNVAWLPGYEGFIPIGMLTLIAGLQGYGKSLLTCLIAAQETKAGRTIAIATAEDSIEHVVIPRLEAAGANLNLCRIVALTIGDDEEELRLPDHIALLEEAILEARPSVLFIDPISAYLGSNIDSWKDSDVRSALRPLGDLALAANMAMPVVAHLNKGGGSTDYLQRVAGNMAFTAAARSSLLFGADPTDPEGENGSQRILALGKSNLAARNTRARQYRIDTVHLSAIPQEDIPETQAACLVFLAEVEISDKQILAGPQSLGSDQVITAAALITNTLEDGEPRLANDMYAIGEEHDISQKIMRTAAKRIGVIMRKQGFGKDGWWTWQKPGSEPADE